ncbi:hypothetical protein HZS_2858 [Henneguya salminicola]|nr:hypothetical protein HZS_2858 [Henneguya salminicola]
MNLFSLTIILFGLILMFFQSYVVFYIISLIFIIIGFLGTILFWSYFLWLNETYLSDNAPIKWNTGLPGIINFVEAQKISIPTYNPTGIEPLDHAIEHLTYLIMQDFIIKWHDYYFQDKIFPEIILKNVHVIINRLCDRIQSVKWRNVFAIKINGVFTLHVKIFIKAIKKLENNQIQKNQTKIISEFFNIETITPNISSHISICTDSTKEAEFLTFIVESLLYLLLPDIQFDEKDILVTHLFLPLINRICDPDYVNQIIHSSVMCKVFKFSDPMHRTRMNHLSTLLGSITPII